MSDWSVKPKLLQQLYKGELLSADLSAEQLQVLDIFAGSLEDLDRLLLAKDFTPQLVEITQDLTTLNNWAGILQLGLFASVDDCKEQLLTALSKAADAGDEQVADIDWMERWCDMGEPLQHQILAARQFDMSKPFAELVLLLASGGGLSNEEVEAAELVVNAKKRLASSVLESVPAKKTKFAYVDLIMLTSQQKVLLAKNLGLPVSEPTNLKSLNSAIVEKSKEDILSSLDSAARHCDAFYQKGEVVFKSNITRMPAAELEIGNVITFSCASMPGADHYFYVVVAVHPEVTLQALTQDNIVGLPRVGTLDVSSSVAKHVWVFSTVDVTGVADLQHHSPVPFQAARKIQLDLTESSESDSGAEQKSLLEKLLSALETKGTASASDTYNKVNHQPLATMLGGYDKVNVLFKGKVSATSAHILYGVLPKILHGVTVMNNTDKLKAFLVSAFIPSAVSVSATKAASIQGVTIHDLLHGKNKIGCVDDLKEAIENFGAVWDYIIDASGRTQFMREVLQGWLLSLDKRTLGHMRDLPLDSLLDNFSACAFEFSIQVNRADAHDISREILKGRFVEAFAIDEKRLLMGATASVFASVSSGRDFNIIPSQAKKGLTKNPKLKGQIRGGGNTPTNSSLCFAHLPYALKLKDAKPCSQGSNCFRLHDISGLSKQDLLKSSTLYGGTYKQAVCDAIKKMSA